MCSLAFPAMALAEDEPVEEAAAEEPAEEKMPEAPKVAADDMAEEYADAEGEQPFLDGLSWQVLASTFYRIGGYTGEGVRAGTYNTLGYPYTN